MNREYKVINSNNRLLFYIYIYIYIYIYVNSRCSSHNEISPLIKDDNIYASLDYDKAILLNEQFTSIFTIDNGIITDHTLKTNDNINNVTFTRENIRHILSQLSHSYTIPQDKISYFIFKKFSYDLSLPLSIIFNKSINSGKCPFMWKYSFITPIFKNGDPSVIRKLSANFNNLYNVKGI